MRTFYFFASTSAVLTFSFFGFVPILGMKVYFYSFKMAMLSSIAAYGFRPVYSTKRPESWGLGGLRAWGTSIFNQNNVQMVMYSCLFLSGRPVTIALGPLLITCLYQWVTIANKLMEGRPLWERFGKGLYARMEGAMVQALVMMAAMEIATAFYLIMEMFTSNRNPLRMVVYWNFLRMRYRNPDNIVLRLKYAAYTTSFYHQEVWKMISTKLAPVLNIRQVQPVVNFAKTWFTGVRPHVA